MRNDYPLSLCAFDANAGGQITKFFERYCAEIDFRLPFIVLQAEVQVALEVGNTNYP